MVRVSNYIISIPLLNQKPIPLDKSTMNTFEGNNALYLGHMNSTLIWKFIMK